MFRRCAIRMTWFTPSFSRAIRHFPIAFRSRQTITQECTGIILTHTATPPPRSTVEPPAPSSSKGQSGDPRLAGAGVHRTSTIHQPQLLDSGSLSADGELLPAIFPEAASPYINMQYGQPEFWRVVNASTQAFLTLQLMYTDDPQQLEVVALDGVPLPTPLYQTEIDIPPAGRAEFIVPGLPSGQQGQLITNGYNTGPVGNPNTPSSWSSLRHRQREGEAAACATCGEATCRAPALCRSGNATANGDQKPLFLRADGWQQRTDAILHYREGPETPRLPHGLSARRS